MGSEFAEKQLVKSNFEESFLAMFSRVSDLQKLKIVAYRSKELSL